MSRLLIVFTLFISIGSQVSAAESSPQESIEESLMCYCGCADLTVRVCTCGTAASIRQDIATRLANGETEEEVLASFIARHGEQILSAPTKEGFNLLAWIMPFAVLLVAGMTLIVVILRWEKRGAAARAAAEEHPPGSAAELSDDERRTLERVEREMREDH